MNRGLGLLLFGWPLMALAFFVAGASIIGFEAGGQAVVFWLVYLIHPNGFRRDE